MQNFRGRGRCRGSKKGEGTWGLRIGEKVDEKKNKKELQEKTQRERERGMK